MHISHLHTYMHAYTPTLISKRGVVVNDVFAREAKKRIGGVNGVLGLHFKNKKLRDEGNR